MAQQPIHAYLKDPTGAGGVLPHVQRLLEIRRILLDALPAPLRQSCSIANYKQGVVVIFAENGATASKLKLITPTLCEHLNQHQVHVNAVRVEVQPNNPQSGRSPKAVHTSAQGAQALRTLSSQLPDSELKTIVMRLADHLD